MSTIQLMCLMVSRQEMNLQEEKTMTYLKVLKLTWDLKMPHLRNVRETTNRTLWPTKTSNCLIERLVILNKMILSMRLHLLTTQLSRRSRQKRRGLTSETRRCSHKPSEATSTVLGALATKEEWSSASSLSLTSRRSLVKDHQTSISWWTKRIELQWPPQL